MKEFIKKKLQENLTLLEFKEGFDMDKFKQLKSYDERIAYCEANLGESIGDGSSRIVYRIDNEKVLKLAKNDKGLAQNLSEIKLGSKYPEITAKVYDSEPNGLWVVMEFATPLQPNQLLSLMGYDRVALLNYLKYIDMMYIQKDKEKTEFYERLLSQEDELDMMKNDIFVNKVAKFMIKTKTPSHELTKLSSYGIVKRNGVDTIVLIDFGMTGGVFKKHYVEK